MKRYIGVKEVKAVEMSIGDFRSLINDPAHSRGMNGVEEGYLVEYLGSPSEEFVKCGFSNYISWSPKSVFEEAYSITDKKLEEIKQCL